MSETDARLILVYAESNMNGDLTARKTHYSRNSISYHLNKIKCETGLNPKNFFDLIELYKMAQDIVKEVGI